MESLLLEHRFLPKYLGEGRTQFLVIGEDASLLSAFHHDYIYQFMII